MKAEAPVGKRTLGLMLGALGVVYGDIGTSPLYALRECFHGSHAVAVTRANVLGVLSLILWSLVLIVSVKYLMLVLRANNRGEGGILSLLALAFEERASHRRSRALLVGLGVFGAALLYGDGMITPAISVLSAVEGLEVATPLFRPYVVPLTMGVLVALFASQRLGTGGVGRVFGPVMLTWFAMVAALGLRGVWRAPTVLLAINPGYGLQFLATHGLTALVVLGAVFLAITGAEALYADLGHFGASPIRRAWFSLVFPTLVLNYLGQGALLLTDPGVLRNPFYGLAPKWALLPTVGLATAAAVIASQALISGTFSLTMQAVQLGYLPRLEIRHTSSETRGQIFLPQVNVLLMLCCLGLVAGFQSSSRLSAAYGIAVTLTMLSTSILFYFAARRLWNWSAGRAGAWCVGFGLLELVFFAGNAIKILQGGWFPLLVAGFMFAVMTTWKTGRRVLGERLSAAALPVEVFVESLRAGRPTRVRGTAVYMSGNPHGTPLALLHNLKHNKVLHERIVLLTIVNVEEPHVPRATRVRVEEVATDIFRVQARYGFMERATMTDVLAGCAAQGFSVKLEEATFFLSRETILATTGHSMARWRERLFVFLSRNAQTATAFFGLPANRVVELGMQVEF